MDFKCFSRANISKMALNLTEISNQRLNYSPALALMQLRVINRLCNFLIFSSITLAQAQISNRGRLLLGPI